MIKQDISETLAALRAKLAHVAATPAQPLDTDVPWDCADAVIVVLVAAAAQQMDEKLLLAITWAEVENTLDLPDDLAEQTSMALVAALEEHGRYVV